MIEDLDKMSIWLNYKKLCRLAEKCIIKCSKKNLVFRKSKSSTYPIFHRIEYI
jgi:hypothetical protein